MAIVAATFREAGWETVAEKQQHGPEIEIPGLLIAAASETAPQGGVVCPETKRLGLLAEISSLRAANQKIPLALVERLTGRLGNIGQVVAEGRAYLAQMHALGAARRRHSAKRSNANGAPPAKRLRACNTGSPAHKLPASRLVRAGGYRSSLLASKAQGQSQPSTSAASLGGPTRSADQYASCSRRRHGSLNQESRAARFFHRRRSRGRHRRWGLPRDRASSRHTALLLVWLRVAGRYYPIFAPPSKAICFRCLRASSAC